MRMNLKLLLAFGVGFIATAGATLAQSYGRGRNVQFVDGAAISPSSVTTSGAVTAGSVVSNGNTTTQTLNVGTTTTSARASVFSEATGDAPSVFSSNDFIVGRDASSGASSGAVFLRYDPTNNQGTVGVLAPGAAWKRMRLRGIDYQFVNPGDQVVFGIGATGNLTATGLYNSTTASGNQAFTCTNVGCRLSLGNTGRYLYDTGSTLASIGGLSADTFTATTASGSALTGGGASGAFVLTSNTPDSFTDTGNNGAFELRVANALAANDALFVVKNSLNQPRFVITQDGRIIGYSDIRTNTLQPDSLSTLNLIGRAASGTSVLLRSNGNLSLDTDRAVNIQNNINTDIAHFSKDGLLRVNASNAAKPTCNSTNRGRVFYLDGVTGGGATADTYEICMKDASDVYAWKTIVTP